MRTDLKNDPPRPDELGTAPFSVFLQNIRGLPKNVWQSIFRHGLPSSDRARSQAVFTNFFLHIHPTRVHTHVFKLKTTLGLGVITMAMFIILTLSGILLMVYYKPSVADAYDSILDIHHVVPNGRLVRNIHRWSAHAMVLAVFLHMARVFYTSAYKSPREFNWLIGLALLVVTLALSFTGYLLPWDQLAYWAITIGSNIAQSPREITDALDITRVFDIGGFFKEVLLGSHAVGQEAIIRFYVLHIAVLPIAAVALMAVHFWRIRKDGGLTRPRSADPPPEPKPPGVTKTYGLMAVVPGRSPAVNREMRNTIPSWPSLFYAELAVGTIATALIIALSLYAQAPLKEIANPEVPENPAKAPWYFLGLQEILVYFDPWHAGVVAPSFIIVGLMVLPFIDINPKGNGYYTYSERKYEILTFFLGFHVLWILLIIVGTFLRGPGWNWFWPWEPWDNHKVVAMTAIDLPYQFGIRSYWGQAIFGLLATAAYFAIGTGAMYWWVVKKKGTDFMDRWGPIRFGLTSFLFLNMLAIVIKMVMRLGFNTKYIMVTPWINI